MTAEDRLRNDVHPTTGDRTHDSMGAPAQDAAPPPAAVTPLRAPRWTLLLACTAVAMANLDTAIVNIALPSIQADLDVGRDRLQWVVVAYGLLVGGFLVVGGRLTDRLGRRRTFLLGVTLMAGTSLAAGLAPSASVLFVARGGQGLGAALLVPAALSLVAVTFEEGVARNRAIGVFGAVGGIAGSFGVVVGGLLTAGPGWRWAFFINVPVGLALVAASVAVLPPDLDRDRSTPVELPGAVAVTTGLLLAVYGLHHATRHGWLSGSTLLVAGAAGLSLLAFARLEGRSVAPLVPPSMWRNRTTMSASAAAACSMAALVGFIYLGTLFMQQVLGYSPLRTGIAWLATTATVFVVAIVGGRLAATLGVRTMLASGLGLVLVGALLLTRVTADAGYATGLMPAFVLAGVGFGLCGPAAQIAALAGAQQADAGIAAGLIETMREVGGAAGVALVTTALVSTGGLGGFHTAFVLVAAVAAVGTVVAMLGLGRVAGP